MAQSDRSTDPTSSDGPEFGSPDLLEEALRQADAPLLDDRKQSPRDYVLLYRGQSLSDFSHIHHPDTVESEIARSRGSTSIVDPDALGRDSENVTVESELQGHSLQVSSGVLMRFVPPRYHHLRPLDIVSLQSIRSYSVPEPAFDTLPDKVKKQLWQNEYAQIRTTYNNDEKAFERVRYGWDPPPTSQLTLLMELSHLLDGRTAPIVSFMTYHLGGDQWSDPEMIAKARDIKEKTVKNQIREVADALRAIRDGGNPS